MLVTDVPDVSENTTAANTSDIFHRLTHVSSTHLSAAAHASLRQRVPSSPAPRGKPPDAGAHPPYRPAHTSAPDQGCPVREDPRLGPPEPFLLRDASGGTEMRPSGADEDSGSVIGEMRVFNRAEEGRGPQRRGRGSEEASEVRRDSRVAHNRTGSTGGSVMGRALERALQRADTARTEREGEGGGWMKRRSDGEGGKAEIRGEGRAEGGWRGWEEWEVEGPAVGHDDVVHRVFSKLVTRMSLNPLFRRMCCLKRCFLVSARPVVDTWRVRGVDG